jgi:phosphoribosyl 1,2-cyclic phosphodiesterase
MGFVVEAEGLRIGHVTDLGYATTLARHHLQGCHLLVLESNHDRDMLIDGPYPWPTKQRIMSRMGHLSNPDAAVLLGEVLNPDLLWVLLAHLSQQNNLPELALASCEECLSANGAGFAPEIIVTHQDRPSPTIRVG